MHPTYTQQGVQQNNSMPYYQAPLGVPTSQLYPLGNPAAVPHTSMQNTAGLISTNHVNGNQQLNQFVPMNQQPMHQQTHHHQQQQQAHQSMQMHQQHLPVHRQPPPVQHQQQAHLQQSHQHQHPLQQQQIHQQHQQLNVQQHGLQPQQQQQAVVRNLPASHQQSAFPQQHQANFHQQQPIQQQQQHGYHNQQSMQGAYLPQAVHQNQQQVHQHAPPVHNQTYYLQQQAINHQSEQRGGLQVGSSSLPLNMHSMYYPPQVNEVQSNTINSNEITHSQVYSQVQPPYNANNQQNGAPSAPSAAVADEVEQLEAGNPDEFHYSSEKTAEMNILTSNIIGDEELKAKMSLKLRQMAAENSVQQTDNSQMLLENILDERKKHEIRLNLLQSSNNGRNVSKISDDAYALLSAGIQLHAQNILEQCSTVSRRRRHLSLISSYGYIVKSLALGRGLPQSDTRANLAVKFGADTKTILTNEDLAVRTVLKERTKSWEAEVVDSLKKEIESKPSNSKKNTVDDSILSSSDTRWMFSVSQFCLPLFYD